MLEAAHQALEAAPGIDLSRTGVVVAFFLGCIAYSVRFYKQFTKDGRRFASPLLFPETVFNSPVSHLVATLGIGGPVYSQVGDKSALGSALQTAECWLRCGSADHVLVLGAEEFDPHEINAFHAAGWFRGKNAFIPSEGAGALLLSSSPGIASLTGLSHGHTFFSKTEAHSAALNCFSGFDGTDPIASTAKSWTRRIETQTCGPRLLKPYQSAPFEAFTASAAWDSIVAASTLGTSVRQTVVPYWGLTHQFAAARFAVSGQAPHHSPCTTH
jgi:hypothetical protein